MTNIAWKVEYVSKWKNSKGEEKHFTIEKYFSNEEKAREYMNNVDKDKSLVLMINQEDYSVYALKDDNVTFTIHSIIIE